MSDVSLVRRREIIAALRAGTVPRRGLEQLGVGLERFAQAIDEELGRAALGNGVFKAVRGEYGAGKTFFSRWIQHRAQQQGFATAEVQISETETPLHRLETVYRRAMEHLSTPDCFDGAFRSVLDGWFYGLEEDVLAEGQLREREGQVLAEAADRLLEQRLSRVSQKTPQFQLALRAYRKAQREGDTATADGLAAWLAGQPHVGAAAKRVAGLKGEVDHFGALGFLEGLLSILRDSGFAGLVLILDEVETLQRVRSDVREKGLNALRQLIDEVDSGRFPGLYLAITGTPAFFDGPQGMRRLEPLAQRLHVDFDADPKFDNPRAVQIRLPAFRRERLIEVGRNIRDLFQQDALAPERVAAKADDALIERLVEDITGELGGKVGIAPRIFLRKLINNVLDKIDLHEDFDPGRDLKVKVDAAELTREERAAVSADQVDLDL
jgi:hypothetical protein